MTTDKSSRQSSESFLELNDKGEDEDSINAADASFGHSSETGTNIYGLSRDDLPNLTDDLLCLHQRYCEQVHRWLEGEPPPQHVYPPSTTQMTAMFNNMRSLVDDAVERNPSKESITSTIKKVALDVIKKSVQDSLPPAIQDIQHSVRAEVHNTLANMPWLHLLGADTRVPDSCHPPIVVQPSTLRSLRRLLGNNASPKSPEQAQILQLVLDCQYHVIGILPTGGGKSALYQVPSFCEQSGITVCIFPFRALTQDQMFQARGLGISSVATWPEQLGRSDASGIPEGIPVYRQHIPIDPCLTRLVCVGAHHASNVEFLPWLKALRKKGVLRRVVLDEAHQLLTSDFRSCISNLRQIQQLDIPILCLSGSLTPAAVPSLIDFFGFPTPFLRIIRADTPRPSISYHTLQVTEEELFPAVVKEIEDFPLEAEERGLIFCNTYDDCERLRSLTGIPVYNSHMDCRERDEHADMWRTGKTKRLICTSGFGNGVSNPHVRHAIHCRDPKKMDRYVQETGRIGRDGKKSKAIMFYTDIPSASDVVPPDAAGQLAMARYLSLTRQCKRIEQSKWLDGEKRVHSCSSLPLAELCDWCLVPMVRCTTFLQPLPFLASPSLRRF